MTDTSAKEDEPKAAKRPRVSENETGTSPRQLEETSSSTGIILIIIMQ